MKPTVRLETIQFLRGVAVLAVVISHATHELASLLAGHLRDFDEKRFPGDFGVDLFFVISGFIMVHVCRDMFARPGAAGDFIRRRLVRIVPLYWIMTTAMIAVVVLLPDSVDTATNDWHQWLASYFFFPYERASDGLVRPVLGLGWSLQYEMLFYVLFALGLLLPRRFGIPAVVAMIVAVWLGGSMAIGTGGSGGGASGGAWAQFLSRPIVLEFAAGTLLGWAFVRGARLPLGVCVFFGVLGVALLYAAPTFDEMVDLSRHILYGVPALLLVVAFTFFPGAAHMRVGPVSLEIGETSYATYLTHPFVLGGLSLVADRLDLTAIFGPQFFTLVYMLVACVSCLAVGYCVHYLLDRPLTHRIAGLVVARQTTRSAGSAVNQTHSRGLSG